MPISNNIYFALKTHEGPRHDTYYLDEQKRIAYASAYFQLEYIERNRTLQSFTAQPTVTDDTLMMLAYHLSYYVMNWVITVMEQVDASQIITHYLEEDHFLANVEQQKSQYHQSMQRTYMQAMVANTQQTTDLQRAIHTAIQHTSECLRICDV